MTIHPSTLRILLPDSYGLLTDSCRDRPPDFREELPNHPDVVSRADLLGNIERMLMTADGIFPIAQPFTDRTDQP